MEQKERIIEGFYFSNGKIAEQARREANGVKYIRENTDMDNPEILLQLYQKLLEENLFETPVGLGFLKELRDELAAIPSVGEQELAAIPTDALLNQNEVRGVKREMNAERSRMERRQEQWKKRLRASLAVNLFLGIVMIGILVIAMTNDHPNIINYENKLVDKYAQWQQELDEREQTIKEKERELGITP